MESDREYMNCCQMPNMYNGCDMKYKNCDGIMPKLNMPPYLYNNCMNVYDGMSYNHEHRMDMNPGFYQMQNIEPIEHMCGKTYKILIVHVENCMQKIMMENMGVMPKAMSKEKFNKHMNDMICEVMKKEEEIKKHVVIDRNSVETSDDLTRSFCPYCNGMLKDALSILFVTQLLKRGCTHCY